MSAVHDLQVYMCKERLSNFKDLSEYVTEMRLSPLPARSFHS